MTRNEVFTFTAPNGVEVTGVAIDTVEEIESPWETSYVWLCYAQNRLFLYKVGWLDYSDEYHYYPTERISEMKNTLVEYCVIPEYDKMLEDYQHQLDMADDYASREY